MAGEKIQQRNPELQKRYPHTNTIQLFYIENAIHDKVQVQLRHISKSLEVFGMKGMPSVGEQGSSSVTAYFKKLRSLWDERDALCGFPPCHREAAAELKNYLETQKTMKFLMGLGHGYATLRRNVLGMDPLPNVNKAFIMALCHQIQDEDATALLNTYGLIWPYSTHTKKTEKEIEEMAIKVNDLCGKKLCISTFLVSDRNVRITSQKRIKHSII